VSHLRETSVLYQIKLRTEVAPMASYCSYLFPVTLIVALYNGRFTLLGAATALVCADYFVQDPLYSLVNDNPRDYGNLFVFALLAIPTIKFIRELVRPSSKKRQGRITLPLGLNHFRLNTSGSLAIFAAIRRRSPTMFCGIRAV
jgi:Domain of unknown function (DUF4118)